MKTLVLSSLLTLLFGFQAHAVGFYLEPGITYEKGDSKLTWPSPLDDSSGDIQGLGANLKLGIHAKDIFFVGLDASYSEPNFKNSATDYDARARSTLYGAIAGLQAPIAGLRFWGGYIFDGVMDPEEDGGVDVNFTGAKGLKLGLGVKIYLVSVNFEYLDLSYKDSELEKAGPVSGTLDSEFKNKVSLVSVSFPFTF